MIANAALPAKHSVFQKFVRLNRCPEVPLQSDTHHGKIYLLSDVIDTSALTAMARQEFGQPLKEFDSADYSGLSSETVELLNDMNAFLLLGMLVQERKLTLLDLAKVGNAQHGAQVLPPLNLFDNQALFGRVSNSIDNASELVRFAPFQESRWFGFGARDCCTVEYLCAYKGSW